MLFQYHSTKLLSGNVLNCLKEFVNLGECAVSIGCLSGLKQGIENKDGVFPAGSGQHVIVDNYLGYVIILK